jgi:hypothetical protein
MTEKEQSPAELAAFGLAAGAIYRDIAIVSALREAGLVDPLKVAAWAELLATGMGSDQMDMAPEIRAGIAGQLTTFAGMLRGMAAVPAGAGRG